MSANRMSNLSTGTILSKHEPDWRCLRIAWKRNSEKLAVASALGRITEVRISISVHCPPLGSCPSLAEWVGPGRPRHQRRCPIHAYLAENRQESHSSAQPDYVRSISTLTGTPRYPRKRPDSGGCRVRIPSGMRYPETETRRTPLQPPPAGMRRRDALARLLA